MVTDKFVYIIQSSQQEQKLIQSIEDAFAMSFNLKVNGATKEYQF